MAADRSAGRTMKRLRLLKLAASVTWRSAPRRVALIGALNLALAVAIVVQLFLVRETMAALGGSSSRDVHAAIAPLTGLLVLLFLAGVVRQVINLESDYVAEQVRDSATVSIARSVLAEPLVRFEESAFHDRLDRARLYGGFRAFQIVSSLSQAVASIASSVAIVVALIALAPAALLPFLVLPLVYAPILRRDVDEYSGSIRGLTPSERVRNYFASLLTDKQTAAEVRAYQLGPFLLSRYAAAEQVILDRMRAILSRRLWRSVLGEALVTVASALAVVWVVYLYGSDRISAAASLTVLFGLSQLRGSFAALMMSGRQLFETATFFEDYSELQLIPVSQGVLQRPASLRSLRVDNVYFTYPGAHSAALKGVSLEIAAGEIVALVGENGSGKTTLARVVAGLYAPESGEIEWNGQPYSDYGQLVAEQVAFVPQEFARYQLSARENVGVGDVDQLNERARVEVAAESAGIAAAIRQLPGGYDEVLGRPIGTTDLSVGQWQRMALARAFFRDASLVILDEPTAALDARAERALYTRARELFRGRSVLFVSHRLSTTQDADRVIVLSEGAIVETGTHSELVGTGGAYAELYRLQAAGYSPGASA